MALNEAVKTSSTQLEGEMMRFREIKERLRLAWDILRDRDGNLELHAATELRALGYFDGDEMNALMASNVIDLIRTFSAQGHSGFSAGFCRSIFAKAAAFEPLCPLTGKDSEWGDAFDLDGTQQNRRCSHVFKNADGSAYDINGVVFSEPNGCSFTGKHSKVSVTFPYVPRTVYANVPEDATDEQRQAAAAEALSAA